LDYFKAIDINWNNDTLLVEDYQILLNKTIALVAFFTILSPNKLANLNRQNFREDSESALLCTKIETVSDQLINIFIQKLKNIRICLWFYLSKLLEYNGFNFSDNSELIWCQPKEDSRLTSYHVRKILTDNLSKLSIPFSFTAYSYKHTTIYFLIKYNIPQR
jgi:hypothetical protein